VQGLTPCVWAGRVSVCCAPLGGRAGVAPQVGTVCGMCGMCGVWHVACGVWGADLDTVGGFIYPGWPMSCWIGCSGAGTYSPERSATLVAPSAPAFSMGKPKKVHRATDYLRF
jgi:hypothetical protein